MGKFNPVILLLICMIGVSDLYAKTAPVSEATQECLDCHASFHPGIVQDWERSRHAMVTPDASLSGKENARRISGEKIPEHLQSVAVGCAECHTMRNGKHADAFEHNGADIHIVVSPDDCAVCHTTESDQFSRNIMAHAYANLADNAVYRDLQRTIIGQASVAEMKVTQTPADDQTRAETCYYCHGTRLEITGTSVRDTDVGELTFPVIKGWPNQGVGRINTDGSKGSCAACHTRHAFSIETARKPHTCKECHAGPDVPAYKVYSASKHGNIYSSEKDKWNFKAVPWTIGKDFTAPTCAACHISQTANTDGMIVSERTHQMSDRLSWRIFGIIYAHPQPIDPDTTRIRNKDGLPLPTDFQGGFADKYLIGKEKQDVRRQTMQAACLNCHGAGWVNGHFARLDMAVKTTNGQVLAATQLLQNAWQNGWATGPLQNGNAFDEYIERRWTDIWLLYANNARFSAAMAGGGDYSVYADGRYFLSNRLFEMTDWLHQRRAASGEKGTQ